MTLYTRFAAHIDAALDALTAAGDLPGGLARSAVTVEPPRDASHGDLATNAAMVLAKPASTNPRALAEKIAAELGKLDEVASVAVAGPGFINLTLTDDTWRDELAAINDGGRRLWPLDHRARADGQCRICLGQPDRADAHGALPRRGGGRRAGAACSNWAGTRSSANIMSTMPAGRSIRSRARRTCGIARRSARTSARSRKACIRAIIWSRSAKRWRRNSATNTSAAPESEWLVLFRKRAVAAMLVLIKADLALLGIHHDLFSSEAELQAAKQARGGREGIARARPDL